jgi:hypothetical protein
MSKKELCLASRPQKTLRLVIVMVFDQFVLDLEDDEPEDAKEVCRVLVVDDDAFGKFCIVSILRAASQRSTV